MKTYREKNRAILNASRLISWFLMGIHMSHVMHEVRADWLSITAIWKAVLEEHLPTSCFSVDVCILLPSIWTCTSGLHDYLIYFNFQSGFASQMDNLLQQPTNTFEPIEWVRQFMKQSQLLLEFMGYWILASCEHSQEAREIPEACYSSPKGILTRQLHSVSSWMLSHATCSNICH